MSLNSNSPESIHLFSSKSEETRDTLPVFNALQKMLETQVELTNKVEFHDDPNLPEKLGAMSDWIIANTETFAQNAAETLKNAQNFLKDRNTRIRLSLAGAALVGAFATGCGPYDAEAIIGASASPRGPSFSQAAGEAARQTVKNAADKGEIVAAAIPPALQKQVNSIVAQMEEAKKQSREISGRIGPDFDVIMAYRTGHLPSEALDWWLKNGDPSNLDRTLDSEALGRAVEEMYRNALAAGQAVPTPSSQP